MTSPLTSTSDAPLPPVLKIYRPGDIPSVVGPNLLAWDDGRLLVNADFAPLLERCGLTTFDAICTRPIESVARQVGERVTGRFTLSDGDIERGFYLKRHGPPRWQEWLKAWLRLTWPVLGARAEWQAMLWFCELGIPAPLPVALGEADGKSFTVATAIEPHIRLDHWSENRACNAESRDPRRRREWLVRLARLVRRIHQAGLHHQDLYLCHLLLTPDRPEEISVIDLGRVRRHRQLPLRWVVKDLSQLRYSSPQASRADRLRFLREYLGRRVTRADRRLMAAVNQKADRIGRHTARHGL